ncbi:Glycine betaine methyltransferase [Eubacterium callanderi]|uniref:trimethylamine methyltransferase family protein n=1 Tax=Eubacterium callanderi TaxID=53442 RepID=UPI0029FECBA6|nr:trimethylamine methyltransferase family protein [Eubacterium callanderi]WPK69194.1 Glycine betaine methyltransferase [Eubacterium callanderi]WPK73492.1 Glycine betaine methyltransferase [Eubacterium callanderi]
MNIYEHYIKKNDVEKIHEESLRILENVGVCYEDDRALEALRKRGAKIEGNIAFLPRNLVEESLKTTPPSFVLKNKEHRLQLGHAGLAKFPWGLSIYKNEDGVISKLTDSDLIRMYKLADSSDVLSGHINFNLYENRNWTAEQKKFGEMAMALKYSNKPTFVSGEYDNIEDFYTCIDTIKMFNGMNLDDMENNYVTMLRMNPLSPLTFDRVGIQFVLAACDRRQPVMIAPCAMPSLTGPSSIAGLLAMTNAEILGGIVLTQVLCPGLPVLYGNTSASADLRSVLLCIGTPETALISYATVALGRYYDLPTRTGGALSDAKDADFQAGAESTLMMNTTLQAGADFTFHVCGLMGSFNVISEEKFILDEENCRILERLEKGIDFSDKKFNFDMIQKVGPRGNFLKIHTSREYRKEFYLHKVFNKEDPMVWQNKGAKSLKNVAKELANKRVAEWTPAEITKEQEKILDKYLPELYKKTI